MVHASLFSGFGAPDLAALWMGWDNAFWCETDDFCRQILKYWFPKSKGYGNIKETNFTPWRGKIDILTGGFPCQPFSVAGQRKGSADDRYLWPEMLRAIREIRPAWVISENVAGILSMVQPSCEITVESQTSLFEEADKETLLEEEFVVETVCRSLEEEGYSVQPVVIPACAVGAPHRRDRVFFIANCTDARIEDMRPERENTVYGFETSSDANGHDAGRSGYGETERPTGGCQESERQREWLRGGVKRNGKERVVTNAQRQRSEQIQQEIQSVQTKRNVLNCFSRKRDAPHPYSQQLENARRTWNRFSQPTNLYSRRTWQDFPTQSPLCRGNDGLPFDVVCLTIPLTTWRTGAIKGYGNAIVPQVMYEIFKAIEQTQELEI